MTTTRTDERRRVARQFIDTLTTTAATTLNMHHRRYEPTPPGETVIVPPSVLALLVHPMTWRDYWMALLEVAHPLDLIPPTPPTLPTTLIGHDVMTSEGVDRGHVLLVIGP